MQITVTDKPTRIPDLTSDGYLAKRGKGITVQCLPGNEHSFFLGFSRNTSYTGPDGGVEIVPGNSVFISSARYVLDGSPPYLICRPNQSVIAAWEVL